MSRVDLRATAAAARSRHGVLSHAELHRLGLSDSAISRWVASGRLHRLHSGVYSIGHDLVPLPGELRAAALAVGPDAGLSFDTAVASHRILPPRDRSTHITIPYGSGGRVQPAGVKLHRSRSLVPEDLVTVDGLTVTSVSRTIVDIASTVVAGRRNDVAYLERLIHEAEVMRLLDVAAVMAVADRRRGLRGTGRLRRLLDVPAPPSGEKFVRLFLAFCQRYSISTPSVGVHLDAGLGHLTEADIYFPAEQVIIELDGAAVHMTRKRFESDRRRDAALLALGVVTVRVTWHRLARDRAVLAREIRAILDQRRAVLPARPG